MPQGGYGITPLRAPHVAIAGSFTISPAAINNNNPAPVQLTLTGTGTDWDATTIFDVAGVPGLVKTSQVINSLTSAFVFVTTTGGFGLATITETVTGTASANFTVVNVPPPPGGGGGPGPGPGPNPPPTPGEETDQGHSRRVQEYARQKFEHQQRRRQLLTALHAADDDLLLVEMLTGAIGNSLFGKM